MSQCPIDFFYKITLLFYQKEIFSTSSKKWYSVAVIKETLIKWGLPDWRRFFRPNEVENRTQSGALWRIFRRSAGKKDASRWLYRIYQCFLKITANSHRKGFHDEGILCRCGGAFCRGYAQGERGQSEGVWDEAGRVCQRRPGHASWYGRDSRRASDEVRHLIKSERTIRSLFCS